MAFSEGQSLQKGKYTIDRVLNSGRFGVSYLAHDGREQRFVIKTFRDDIWQQQSDAEKEKWNNRALREGGLLAQFDHPYIVQFLKPFFEDGQVCLVMEYVAGTDLATLAEEKLPIEDALIYIQQVGEALKVVHAQKLVHRDVKPANIILRAGKPEVVLIDFGLAGKSESTLTMNTSTRQAGFAAPELYDSTAPVGSYTDVYSLGATLYALLVGVAPPVADQRRSDRLPAIAGVEKRVQGAIERAMALDWEKRLQTVDEFLDLLGVKIEARVNPEPDPQEILEHTRLQTRLGAQGVFWAVITLIVTVVLTLYGDELKRWLRPPVSVPTPQESQE